MLTHQEYLEIGKLMSDFFKQLITLDTGLVILIVTIVDKIFTRESVFKSGLNRFILIISVVSFIGSLLFALNALVVIPTRLTVLLKGGIVDKLVDTRSFNGTIYFFLSGVTLFIFLAIRSVFNSSTPAAGEAKPTKT